MCLVPGAQYREAMSTVSLNTEAPRLQAQEGTGSMRREDRGMGERGILTIEL